MTGGPWSRAADGHSVAAMDIAVLGSTGTIGRSLSGKLEEAGHTVRRLSRTTGVDARSGRGLDAALEGAEVVVDAVNVQAIRGDRAVSFFTRAAQNIARSAERAGARRVVCVSIAGAARPEVRGAFGYYRGKAAQERAYQDARIPATIIRSTQWFELAEQMAAQASIGPLAVLPTMRMAPLSAHRAARHIVPEVVREDVAGDRTLAIRGPEEMTTAQLVRRILAARGEIGGRRLRVVTELPYLGRGLAGGGLIPRDGIVDELTLGAWLDGGGAAAAAR